MFIVCVSSLGSPCTTLEVKLIVMFGSHRSIICLLNLELEQMIITSNVWLPVLRALFSADPNYFFEDIDNPMCLNINM